MLEQVENDLEPKKSVGVWSRLVLRQLSGLVEEEMMVSRDLYSSQGCLCCQKRDDESRELWFGGWE